MNRSTFAIFAIAITMITLSSCGKKELGNEEKEKLKEVMSSMGNTMNASRSAQPRSARSGELLGVVLNDASSDMAAKLSKCQFNDPTEGASSGDLGLSVPSLKLSGEGCPITLEVSMKLDTGAQMEAKMKMFFEVKDAEFAKLTDVTKFDITGSIRGGESSGSGSITGSILSKKYGEIKMDGTFSGSENEVTFEVNYQFNGFTATLKTRQEAGKEAEYYLNGKKMSKSEFESETASAGGPLGGLGGAKGTTTTTSSSQFSYNLTYNGCSTEKQEFTSLEAMCEGLQSSSRNHGCARDLRSRYFTSSRCTGTFTDKP